MSEFNHCIIATRESPLAMWQALLVLLVIVLAVALSRGRAGTHFRHHAPCVGSCDHLRRKMETKNSDDNKLK